MSLMPKSRRSPRACPTMRCSPGSAAPAPSWPPALLGNPRAPPRIIADHTVAPLGHWSVIELLMRWTRLALPRHAGCAEDLRIINARRFITQLAILGIDLAKSVFQLHGVDARGNTLLRKRVSRQKLRETVAMMPQCQIVMEACGSAHYWAREFERLGHRVRLISAQYVKPFVKSQKNDRNDAEAICEAAQRPNMRFVPVKSAEQQDIQAAHRLRGLLVKHQTALVNQIRGLLAEYGIVVRQGRSSIYKALPDILEDAENGLSSFVRRVFANLYEQLKSVMQQIRQADTRLVELFSRSAACQRIAEIPGVGPLTSTAMVAAVGDAKSFRNGRHLAAWLGLIPAQSSSGGKVRLLGITKRGDKYLRSLLIHGARTVCRYAIDKTDRKSRWLQALIERRGMNRAAVALANKRARTIQALLATGAAYQAARLIN